RQLYYCSPKWLKLQEKYYQRGENLLNLTFERSFIAPLGLNLLEVFDDEIPLHKFTQIKQNINLYYENFLINFQQNSFKAVYPPRFYVIMKKQKKDMNE
ncbi:competence protein CoiA, partial [Lactococcus lactis subsp. lactis]|nr:competence protein CoiA [Lactococcus lactis subsp. lactis]